MAGLNGIAAPASLQPWLPDLPAAATAAVDSGTGLLIALALLALAWLAPNTQQITGYRGPEHDPAPAAPATDRPRWTWMPQLRGAAFAGLLFGLGLVSLSRVSEFLYFQF
jgi:hypothetical protein